MDKSDPQFDTFEYLTGQQRDTHPGLLAGYEARSLDAVRRRMPQLDVAYGAHPRQKLDVFLAQGEARGSILYFHPGYWQSRDKSTFRFLADWFVSTGYNCVLANYPLCPDVTLDQLVEHVAEAVPFTLNHLVRCNPRGKGLIVAGHSAGGHLAVEMALRSWPEDLCNGRPVERILPISGVFELEPLLSTPLNDKLRLSSDDARRNSPTYRARNVGIPAAFLVGGGETAEFRRQSREMCAAWEKAGNPARYIEIPREDHLSVVSDLSATPLPNFLAETA